MSDYQLVVANTLSDNDLSVAAQILCDEWNGFISNRVKKMKMDRVNKCFILLRKEDQMIVGYGELEISAISSSTSFDSTVHVPNGILTSFIIAKSLRSQGVGSIALKLFEEIVRERGYYYLYLWTSTAKNFYQKHGYHECEPINGNKSILKSLDEESVSKIESILKLRFHNDDFDGNGPILFTSQDVWLRKRMIKSQISKYDMNWETFHHQIVSYTLEQDLSSSCYYKYHKLPWKRQVGPSCGLTALSMIINYFSSDEVSDDKDIEALLDISVDRGYTNDGEMFRIENLVDIAKTAFENKENIQITIHSTIDVSYMEITDIILHGGLILMAYDRDDIGSLPCKKLGLKSHYIVIIGFLLHSSISSGIPLNQLELCSTGMIDSNQVHQIHLIGLQTLSPRPVIAPFSTWMESNQQLECKLDIYQNHWFKIHEPNISSQMIVFRNSKHLDIK